TARDLKGASFEDAGDIVRSKAERQLHETIREAIEENLPSDSDPSEWTWVALATWANNRFELNLKEKDLKKFARQDGDEFEFGREDLEELLHEKASASIEKLDLNPAREFLEPDWGRHYLVDWAQHKFGLAIDPESWSGLDRAEIIRRLQDSARQHYALKEAELPVRIASRGSWPIARSTCLHAMIGRVWRPGRRNGFTPSSTPLRSGRCCGPRSRLSC